MTLSLGYKKATLKYFPLLINIKSLKTSVTVRTHSPLIRMPIFNNRIIMGIQIRKPDTAKRT